MRTAAPILLYAAAAVLGTYVTFRPTFDTGFAHIQTEKGDGLLNHLILENSWLAVSDPGYRGTLASPPFFFPERRTLFYSENLFGVAPAYWALRLFLPPDLAYPWWQTVLNALNFVAFALAARWLRLPHLLALAGAFLWAFATVHADQIKHQQMIPRFWMPLAVYYAVALAFEPSAKALNRLCGCVFLQSLTCIYTGWFLVAGLAVFLPVLLGLREGSGRALRRFVLERKWAVLRIVGLWGLAMAALFVPYVVVNWGMGREYKDSFGLLPTPGAWITGPPGSPWWYLTEPWCDRKAISIECFLFCGFAVYALMLAAMAHLPLMKRESRPALWPVAAAAMVTVVLWWLITLATAPNGASLWQWVRYVPGGQAIRCVSRVYVVVYLFGTLGGLAWLHMATGRLRREWVRTAIHALVASALVFEQAGVASLALEKMEKGLGRLGVNVQWSLDYEQGSFPRAEFYPRVDRVAAGLKGADAAYVVPGYLRGDPALGRGYGPYDEVFAMWVGLRANVPVVNGYTGRLPEGHPGIRPLSDEQLRTWLAGRFRGRLRVIDSEHPHAARDLVFE
jgi:hypothetical protein